VRHASDGRWLSFALLAAAMAAVGAWLDLRYGWITPVFATVRRTSQLTLVRGHLAIGSILLVVSLLLAPRLNRHGRVFMAIFGIGYIVRAALWICGSNLPLVPGDSCHYLEVATSVLRGDGPVKHYVESYFSDYPRIRLGQGVLDDWATPLDAYVRALALRLAGVTPASSLEWRFAVAKTCSFAINKITQPVLNGVARRRYGARVAIWTMAVLAILPVHAIYAGFVLRESLVALTSVLAVWTLTEIFYADPRRRALWAWTVAAGVCAGLAALSRTTALALLAGAGLCAIVQHGRQRLGPLLLWGAIAALVCAPWAWVTLREYGSPFYSYTGYFEYNFSWTVHHYEKGNTLPSQFYTRENLPEIARIKIKSLVLIVVYSSMIVGLPIVIGFCKRLARADRHGSDTDRLVATIGVVFALATLKSIADVTQVAQLGRYYLPVFALALPAGVAGLIELLDRPGLGRSIVCLFAVTYCGLVWADPTWAYDASWLSKRYQLHWPAIEEAGTWISAHPDQISPDARIMTWFPWELRVTSDRTTILMPRNYDASRIKEVIAQYEVTHILWGSFEPPPYYEVNPESWTLALDRLRLELGLTESRAVYDTAGDILFPLRLYRVR
jgi:hypothetical protein